MLETLTWFAKLLGFALIIALTLIAWDTREIANGLVNELRVDRSSRNTPINIWVPLSVKQPKKICKSRLWCYAMDNEPVCVSMEPTDITKSTVYEFCELSY